jgi:DnaJ-domain-containing protein 1
MSTGQKSELEAYRERAQKMLALDHFALLGVSKTASPADVQKAFVEAAKTWHPDRLPSGFESARSLATQVFGRLETARGTLSDPKRRAEYVASLTAPHKPVSSADLTNAEAELEFKKAEAMLKRNDAVTAEKHLRRALHLTPGNHEAQALLAWIQVKETSTPAELGKLASELDRVVAAAPTSKRAPFYRGQIRKRLGMNKQAYADFARVAELDPTNIDAVREVRLYKMREERGGTTEPKKGDEHEGGFFKKLFKR